MKRKNNVYRCMLLVLILVALSLGSCVPAPPEEGDIFIIDDLDRTVKIKEKPDRVTALLGSFAEVWWLSGGTLVGAASDAWEDFELPLDGVSSVGGVHSPSLEAIISTEPELVIASASTVSHLDMLAPLESMGIAVLYFEVDTFEDYLSMLRRCTEITGREDLYRKYGADLESCIEEIKQRYKGADIPEENRKILLLRASSTAVKPKGSQGTVLGAMLADMGCTNIANSEGSELENISIEAIIRENPYHIFVVTMGKDEEAAMRSFEAMALENPAWSSLDAVMNGRVHFMEKKQFNVKPNARWAQSYEILYQALIAS